MRPDDEQIDAILNQNTSAWAREQLGPGEPMDDRDYADFISVTPDAVVAHVLAQGFHSEVVWTPELPPHAREERIVVEPSERGWEVCYSERGMRSDAATHPTYEGAVRDVVGRLFESAWTSLNHRYWHAHHPELTRLVPFGAPWPRPKRRRA